MTRAGTQVTQSWTALAIILALYVLPSAAIPRSIPLFLIVGYMSIAMLFRRYSGSAGFAFVLATNILLSSVLKVFVLPLTVMTVASYEYMTNVLAKQMSDRILKAFVAMGGVSLLAQLFYFRIVGDDDVRTGLGTDVNFSGVRIFLFFVLSQAVGLRFGWVIIVIGTIFTQSRLLLLLTVLFVVFHLLLKIGRRFGASQKIRWCFVLIIVIVNVLVLLGSDWALNAMTFTRNESSLLIDRISNLNDFSNFGRALANTVWTERVLSGEFLLDTLDLEELDADRGELKPHNSLLYAAVTGTVFFPVIVLGGVWFAVLRTRSNWALSLFMSYFIGACFIHGLYSPIFLFELFFVSAVLEAQGRRGRLSATRQIPHFSKKNVCRARIAVAGSRVP